MFSPGKISESMLALQKDRWWDESRGVGQNSDLLHTRNRDPILLQVN